jgi:hypothetical protein
MWATIAFVALIPVGLVGSVVWMFWAGAEAERQDPGGMSGEWLPLAALMGFGGWTALCTIGALICGLISSDHRHRP